MPIVVSTARAAELSMRTKAAIRRLVERGRIAPADVLIDNGVRQGVSFESLCAYHGWSESTKDEILFGHGIDPDDETVRAYLTVRGDE